MKEVRKGLDHDLAEWSRLIFAEIDRGDLAQAEGELRAKVEFLEYISGPERGSRFRLELAKVLVSEGKLEEAEAEYRICNDIWEHSRFRSPYEITEGQILRAMNLSAMEKFSETVEILEKAVPQAAKVMGLKNELLFDGRMALVLALSRSGQTVAAETETRKFLEEALRAFGPDDARILMVRSALGMALTSLGQYEQAETVLKAVLVRQEEKLGKVHRDTLTTRKRLAVVWAGLGRYVEAEKDLREMLKTEEYFQGADHPRTLITLEALVECLEVNDKDEEARTLLERLVEATRKELGPENPKTKSLEKKLYRLIDPALREPPFVR